MYAPSKPGDQPSVEVNILMKNCHTPLIIKKLKLAFLLRLFYLRNKKNPSQYCFFQNFPPELIWNFFAWPKGEKLTLVSCNLSWQDKLESGKYLRVPFCRCQKSS